jgi:hypothetical protein
VFLRRVSGSCITVKVTNKKRVPMLAALQRRNFRARLGGGEVGGASKLAVISEGESKDIPEEEVSDESSGKVCIIFHLLLF